MKIWKRDTDLININKKMNNTLASHLGITITNIDDSLSTVIKEMNNNGYKYMKSIRIKDIFISKDKLQLNNRNVTLEICLQSMDRTLNDEDINKSIQSITTDIKKLYKLNIQEA